MKKVLSVLLSVVMLFSIVAFAVPVVELDTAESVTDIAQVVPAAEGTLSAAEIKPGLNIYTGTAGAATFDDEAQKSGFSIGSDNNTYTSYEIRNLDDGTYNNVLSFYRAGYTTTKSNWAGIKFNNTSFDGVRNYRFTFDYQFSIPTYPTGTGGYWGGFTYITSDDGHKTASGSAAVNNWQKWNMDVVPKNGYTPSFRFWIGVDGDSGTCDELNTYIDNVSVIPYYIATYYLNDGTDTVASTAQFLYDADGNIMTSYTPDASLAPTRADYVFKGWAVSADSTAVVDSVTLANEDVSLYAVWEKDTTLRKGVKPGLNMAGQRAEAWDFEATEERDMSSTSLFSIWPSDGVSVADNPLKDAVNSSTKVLQMSPALEGQTGTVYPSVSLNLSEAMDSARPVYVSFKYYKTYTPAADETYTEAPQLWVMKNGSTYIAQSINGFNKDAGWKQSSKLIAFNKAHKAGDTSVIDTNAINKISIQNGIALNDGTDNVFYDDITFIPSYKITYMANDGTDTVIDEKYALLDDSGNFLTAYTVDSTIAPEARYKYDFIGWSTDASATDAMTSVTLKNEDIVLYAVWDEDETLPDEAELKWDFETAESQTWKGKYNVTYKNGLMILDSSAIADKNNYINHYAVSSDAVTNTDALRYLVIKARSLGDVSNIKFYFSTSDYGFSYNGTETYVNVPLNANASVFKEFYVDMSAHERWSGDYTGCMLQLSGSSGIVEIEEIKFVTNYDVDDSAPLEYHYDLSTITAWGSHAIASNDDGSVTVTRSTSENGAMNLPVPTQTLASSVYTKLVIKMSETGITSMGAHYDIDNADDANEFTGTELVNGITPVTDAAGNSYFVFDFTTDAEYTGEGNWQRFMIPAGNIASGTITDIWLTNKFEVPTGSDAADYVWDFEDGTAPGCSAWSGHTSFTLENGDMVIKRISNTEAGTSSGGIDFTPQSTLAAADYPYMVFKVAKTNDGASGKFQIYYVTGEMTGITGAGNVTTTAVDYDDENYYYFKADFSAKGSDYATGNIKKFVVAPSNVGTFDVEEVILTNDLSFIGFENDVEVVKEVEKTYLNGAETITSDKGTTTLSPYIRYTDGSEETDFAGTTYITDSVCAQVVTNQDGTATVIGQINGTVNVTAIFPDGETKIVKTITITGQADRIAATDLNVVMFGNSIRKHGPSPSIGWPAEFNWGMAASSEAQDYAHRFVYYMEQKYGEGNVTLHDTTSIAAYERAINNWQTDATQGNTIKDSVATFINEAKKANADIITFQLGENASGADYEEYYTATLYMLEIFKEEFPDAVIVACTPFWGGEGKINGLTQTTSELDIPLVGIHVLNTNENYAYDAAWITDVTSDGVKRHPGDLGMDNIAKMIYETVNVELSANEKTVYTTTPKTVEITSDATSISEEYGTLQLSASVLPSDAAQEIVWSTSDKNIATVDENGLVSAYNNGTVTITATSRHKSDVYSSIDIEITGQTEPNTVTYNQNTEDWVDNMPEPNTMAKLGFRFDDTYPSRYAYRFLGWSLDPNGTEADVLTVYDVTEDITVYAIWEEAYRWDFNRDGYKEEFTIANGFNQYVLDGKFMSIATDTNLETGAVLTVNSPGINIDPSKYYALVIRMQNTEVASDTTLDLTFNTLDGNNIQMTKMVTTTEYTDYEFLLDGIDSYIVGFSFTPTNIDCTINLDHIEFMTEPDFTFDANAGDDVIGNMPASIYSLEADEITVPAAVPTRSGYTFLGWVTSPDSKLLIDTETVAAEVGGKLYAAWDKNDHWEMDSLDDITSVGNVTTYDVNDEGVLYILEDDTTSVDVTVGFKRNKNYDVSTTSKKIITRIKYDFGENASQHSQLFFQTSDYPALIEGNSAHGANYGNAKVDDFIEYEIDLSYKTNFTGILSSFRWDPFQCLGEMWVDYFRFSDSEANIVTENGETRNMVYDDDWGTYIIRDGGVIAPVGGILVKNAAITGDIDMTNGYLMVSGSTEIADTADYAVYTLDKLAAGIDDGDYVLISGYDAPIEVVDGANYIVKLSDGTGYITVGNHEDGTVDVIKLTKDGVEYNDDSLESTSLKQYSVRTTDPISVRFTAFISNIARNATVAAKGYEVKEYGFVVSTGKMISSADELTLVNVDAGKAAKGVAYDGVSGTKDIIYEDLEDGSGVIISAVLKNVPATKDAYTTDIYVRPYISLGNGVVVYGTSDVTTIYDVAAGIAADMAADAPYADYINSIISACETAEN